MASTELDLASLPLSSPITPEPAQDTSKVPDIEMTPPLTEPEDKSDISPILSISPPSKIMDAFGHPWTQKQSNFNAWDSMGRRPSNLNATFIPVSQISPGPVWPTQNQLGVAYGYAIRRPDGTYTQLIPADELHRIDVRKIPATQGPEGLIILPVPVLPRPEERLREQNNRHMVPASVVNGLPLNQPHRQGPPRSPASPPHRHPSPTFAYTTRPIRPTKIYCTKWIHDGTCAFVQVGCRYKHEMPLDKATQVSVGLNNGLPGWYKRRQYPHLRDTTDTSSTEDALTGEELRFAGFVRV